MDTNESNKQGRTSYSEEDRRELIAEFGLSGLTQAAFCREWSINPATFGKWLRTGREEEGKVAFCEVESVAGIQSSNEVRVHLPNRVEVAVPVGSPEDLARVLREAARCLG
ncbi:MAG: transposase [Verrucomicrobiota bacterium]